MTGTRETLASIRDRRDAAANAWILGGHIDSRDAVALIRDSHRILVALESLVDVCLAPSPEPWPASIPASTVLQIIDQALDGGQRPPRPAEAQLVQRRLLDEARARREAESAEDAGGSL